MYTKVLSREAKHTQKEVICVGAPATNLEYLNEVEELAVYIPDDGYGGADVDNVAFAHEQLFRLGAYCFDDGFCKQFLLVQARDALVQID